MFLQSSFQWAGAEVGVEADLGQPFLGLFGKLDRDAMFLETLLDIAHLQINNFDHLVQRERCEGDNFIYAVEELRPESFLQFRLDFGLSFAVFAVVSVAQEAQTA